MKVFRVRMKIDPNIKKMMKLIKSKEIDSLIIYKLDRLEETARDIHNAMAVMHRS